MNKPLKISLIVATVVAVIIIAYKLFIKGPAKTILPPGSPGSVSSPPISVAPVFSPVAAPENFTYQNVGGVVVATDNSTGLSYELVSNIDNGLAADLASPSSEGAFTQS